MANLSHIVPRLAAALPITALLWSCQSAGQKAFRYAEQLQGKAAPTEIKISSDCKVNPEKAVVSVKFINRWNPQAQVVWHLTDQQDGDRVVISGKQLNGPASRSLFQSVYEISSFNDAIRSGSPKKARRLLLHPEEWLVWLYEVDYYRDGKLLCTKDPPEICIQKVGSTGCQQG